jgi:cell division protein FtsL
MSLSKNHLLLFTDLVNQHSGMTEKYGPEIVRKAYLKTSAIQKRLIFALTACVLVTNLLVIFSTSDNLVN